MTRLFVAINFPPAVREQLTEIIAGAKKKAREGNFTRDENLHLTLAFIGETERLEDAKHAVEQISASCFDLTLSGFGTFKRRDGDIFWMGMEKCPPLLDIQKRLCRHLTDCGFEIDKRFTPHLTLGRHVIFQKDFDAEAFAKTVPPMTVPVERISLMKSERVNGRLIYVETASKELQKQSE
ncbi:RNA 2',3'-cyclic phosphodiesterase [Methanolapillus millepedarum]|uniref:RNA 2',3'-cyclic phosphodiesterase n=2 Tax=Methanolapillus millepedarum TaxID=3028296 RepID=A0AA97A4V6_9EURY|nr:RNA 2',3'-cyclic phosphodiesterase [Methanosarcinaceae archaeon Ac7]